MARRRRYKPIVRVRRALLVGLILAGGAVAGYYFSGRFGIEGGSRPPGAQNEPLEVTEGLLTVAHGFDYEVSDGSELAFRVRAEKLVSDVEDRMVLDEVEIELPQESGEVVVVKGKKGTIHLDSKSATLEGKVQARTEDGIELRGQGFEVIREGRTLVSTAPVTFSKAGEYQGEATSLTYGIKKERLILEGSVVIKTLPLDDPQAGTLRSEKLIYDRLERTLRLEGKVRVERGPEFLEASRISMSFSEANDVQFVRAENGVEGRYIPAPSSGALASYVDVRGRLLYAVFEEGTHQARQAELHGTERNAAQLVVTDESGLSRILTAPKLNADFENGEVALAEAFGPVEVEERLSLAAAQLLRRVCSEHAVVEFDALGEMETLTLEESVDYQASGVHARGDSVLARAANGSVEFLGSPAVVVSERGDLEAPRILYQDTGRITAFDGVRAEMRRSSGYSLMGSDTEEPLRITANQARWQEDPELITFTGSVRAWQGQDYLLTNNLVGEPAANLLTATGAVKSVIRPNSDEAILGEPEDGSQEPIEVTARKLIYEQTRRVITYDGDAKAVQGERILSCDDMDVELDEDNEFERLVCTGDLEVKDPAQGKKVEGDRAIYLPAKDEVDVTGDPVVLTDKEGTELRGGRIIYNFETGAARIHSRSEESGRSPVEPPEPDAAEGEKEGTR